LPRAQRQLLTLQLYLVFLLMDWLASLQ